MTSWVPFVIAVYGKEEYEHFFLHCSLFARQLFDQVAEKPGLDISGPDSDVPCSIFLFGCLGGRALD